MASAMKDWYKYLSNSSHSSESLLKSDSGAISPNNSFVVCGQDEAGMRYFKVFENYLYFFSFMKTKVREENRHFYEIIPAKSKVKPYFDLDFSENEKLGEIRGEIINTLRNFVGFLQQEIKGGETIVYTSTNLAEKKLNKMSFHIVINDVYFDKMEDMKVFCDYCCIKFSSIFGRKDKYCERFVEAVDRKVYKNNQQFRMLGSCKAGNPKNVKKIFSLVGSVSNGAVERKDFKNSLITFVLESKPIVFGEDFETFYKTSISKIQKKKLETWANFSEEFDLEKCIEKLKEILGKNYAYSVRDVKDNIVILNRLRSSFCEMCQRHHENEHPFITIIDKGKGLYNCRRSAKSIAFDFSCESPVKSEKPSEEKSSKVLAKFLKKSGNEDKERKKASSLATATTLSSLQTLI